MVLGWLSLSSGLEAATQSFQILVGPRLFSDSDLGSSTKFSTFGKPEVAIRVSPYIFSFGLEPLISASFLANSSKSSGGTKNSYQNFSMGLGARYRPYRPSVFPLVPYLDALLIARFTRLKTRTTIPSSQSSKDSGTDLTAQMGGGLKFSFVNTNRKIRSDMEAGWGLSDFGLDLNASYELPKFSRFGDLSKDLKLQGLFFGGGLYLDW